MLRPISSILNRCEKAQVQLKTKSLNHLLITFIFILKFYKALSLWCSGLLCVCELGAIIEECVLVLGFSMPLTWAPPTSRWKMGMLPVWEQGNDNENGAMITEMGR